MPQIMLSVGSDSSDSNIMLAGWIFPVASLRTPIIDDCVVLKPTLNYNAQLPPGIYYYRFNANMTGKFHVVAKADSDTNQQDSFDVTTDGQYHLSFCFEVRG